jgi:rhamnose utilization protein RhaD (predicted bifunctional aldolase and dehydrogenase)
VVYDDFDGVVLELEEGVRIAKALGQNRGVILQNHGLVVCAATAQEAQDMTLEVIAALALPQRSSVVDMAALDSIAPTMAKYGYRLPTAPTIHQLACDVSAFESISRANNVLYPDQAVFLGKNAFIIDSIEQMRTDMKAPYIVLKGLGVFIQEQASAMVEAMLLCHAQVLLRIAPGSMLNYLSDEQVAALTNWDAEKYRQSIN